MQSLACAFGAALIRASTSVGSRYSRNFFVLPLTPEEGKELPVFCTAPYRPAFSRSLGFESKSFTFHSGMSG